MPRLTDKDIEKIIGLLQQGKPIPEIYKSKLFSSGDKEYIELTKEYQLVYKGKKRKEDIIADTPEAPLQEVRKAFLCFSETGSLKGLSFPQLTAL